jgi:pilus assembly protein FimV
MKRAGRLLRLALGAAAVALLAAPLAAPAQNLGRLALLSRLGEPLDAEIEITAVPAEMRDSLSAQIVPIGVFERFGVTPSPPLEVMRAVVDRGADGRPVVRLKSAVPVERPAVNVIVELAWNGGRMVRQYAFNVDPPERPIAKADAPAPAAQAEAPARAPAAPAAAPVAQPAPAKPAPKPRQVAAVQPKEPPAPKAPVAAKPKEPPAPKKARARPAAPSESEVAAAQDRVKDLERTMRELQERIDARNREIEALQRQVGGTAK